MKNWQPIKNRIVIFGQKQINIGQIKIIADCKLDKYFKDIIFDDKSDFKISIPKLQQLTKSNQFIIYENNEQFFQNQNCKIVDSIQSNLFDINGYLIG